MPDLISVRVIPTRVHLRYTNIKSEPFLEPEPARVVQVSSNIPYFSQGNNSQSLNADV
jgi:hypothetical protein